MAESNFIFLKTEYPFLFNIANAAELQAHNDPVTALFKLRQFGEHLTEALFEEHALEFPYDDTTFNRLRILDDERILPDEVRDLLHNIRSKGNLAVHDNKGTEQEAIGILLAAFKVSKWFYETYSDENKDILHLRFHKPEPIDYQASYEDLEKEHEELEKRFRALMEEKRAAGVSSEKKKEIKERSQKAASRIEMDEAATRELIDAQLRAAGWEANTEVLNNWKKGTLPEKGKNRAIAEWVLPDRKRADYALFIGEELYGVVEAKKWSQDISTDLGQSKIYARLAEEQEEAKLLGQWNEYKVPYLFSTNGRPYLEQLKTKSGIWFLDIRDTYNQPRALQGWFSPRGLQDLYERDFAEVNRKLEEDDYDYLQKSTGLNLRDYQIKAIKAVENKIIHGNSNRALIAMATGTGKTRTIIGLAYRLIKSNRFKRILFLVDRRALAIQAYDSFKDNKVEDLHTFSAVYKIDGLKQMQPDLDTRLHFVTVQGMVKRLMYSDEEQRPAIDTYDCIIVDEAHRGYLLDREVDEEDLEFKNQQDYVSKYRKVLDYFDAYAIGLTATPALHTTDIFGKAVYTYSYREAVIDGYLVDHDPPYQINTMLAEEGIKWEKGSKPKAYDREKGEIKELEELEDELNIDIEGFNKLVVTENFNRVVIKELVQHIDPEGQEKTLIFAATDEHADLVVKLLKEEFANAGYDAPLDAVEKITGNAHKPLELLKKYKNEYFPTVVVTVDLLTTGVDVPPITNLVFLRRVKSRILYDQMLGRATRLCPDIGKESFKIFDAVKIYESLEKFTDMKPVVANPKASFEQLIEEIPQINKKDRLKKQVEQIVGKLQRKKKKLEQNMDDFKYRSNDMEPEELIHVLKNATPEEAVKKINGLTKLWPYLDEYKIPQHQLISFHEDEHRETTRGYGKGQKPEDYLEGFAKFVKENMNKITALQVVCSKPLSLDRKSLKELKMELDQAGFTDKQLNTAWKEIKNEDIAADIISYIRTMALGDHLEDHEKRIKKAVDKVRKSGNWNKVQEKWLDRFESQLIKETVLRAEDLDDSPFKEKGGFQRLNRIFNDRLKEIIKEINKNLYNETA